MQIDQLLTIIKTTLHKSKVNELTKIASDSQFSVRELIDLTFYPDKQISFRAAWILENICIKHSERFIPFIGYFLEKFSDQNNPSAQRHYAKILALITDKKAAQNIQSALKTFPTDTLIETIFSWLIDEKTAVAIKSHCLTILANFSKKNPWIKEELITTMEHLVDVESIGFYARVKRIRKQLSE